MDGFKRDYDAAIVVTNDSDLAEPIRMVKTEFQVPVLVLHPLRPGRSRSVQLRKAASFSVPIATEWLASAQFPSTMEDAHGIIQRPPDW